MKKESKVVDVQGLTTNEKSRTSTINDEDHNILDNDNNIVGGIVEDSSNTWGIKREGNGRYVIIDANTGVVLDDIHGCGCETYDKALSYGYNKYHTYGKCNAPPNIDDYNTLL